MIYILRRYQVVARFIGMITRARAFSTEVLKVVNNVAKQKFVVALGNVEAQLDYNKQGEVITFVHTNVPKVFQGKGVGKLLAQYAFDHALENKYEVICQCHFLAKYYQENINQYKNIQVTLQLE